MLIKLWNIFDNGPDDQSFLLIMDSSKFTLVSAMYLVDMGYRFEILSS